MNKMFAYLLGAGWGAGLMYFFDPEKGKQRRSLISDQMAKVQKNADDAVEIGVRDLQNRLRGITVETSARFSKGQTSDWVLSERVRSKLSFLTQHPGAIETQVQNSTLFLNGDILQDDLDRVIEGISEVRGIRNIENRLNVYDDPGNIPSLQEDNGPMRPELRPGQWSPSTRLLAGIGSMYFLLRGQKGGLFGPLYTLGGLGLGIRALANMNFSQMLGLGDNQGTINVVKSIHIDSSIDDVYNLWSNFQNFPKFMAHVHDIKDLGNRESHWVVDGPAGIPVEFDTAITQEIPGELIAWQTLPDSPVKNTGQVRFRSTRDGGTQAYVRMAYTPPAGVIGHTVASFLGKDPKSEMDDDLLRLKSLLETGKTTVRGETVHQQDIGKA
jgi:uncharacterized membrane protein